MTNLSQFAQLRAQVIDFLAEELDIPAENISMLSRLREDLNISADAADELIQDFGFAFVVNVQSFRISDYFGKETHENKIFAFLLELSGNAKRLKSLTVTDLVTAAERGYL